MEQAYFLKRKRAELLAADKAPTSRARLIHYDLAGRYSVWAAEAAKITAEEAARGPQARLVLSLETSLHDKPRDLDMGLGSRLQAFERHEGR